MPSDEFVLSEVEITAYFLEVLIQRRAAGEFSSLHRDILNASETINSLRHTAPQSLHCDLDSLQDRCATLLRSIAH